MVGGLRAGAAVCVVLAGLTSSMPANAQQLSEKAVKTFVQYAWALTPQKFTKPDGESIMIDKSKPKDVKVPIDDAREVIMAGRLTAHAQICKLAEDQVRNYQSLMRREEASKRWSDQQIVFINQLHLTTVMLLTGQIKLVEKKDGGKDVVVYEGKKATKTCTDEQRAKVKKLIEEYVASEPKA